MNAIHSAPPYAAFCERALTRLLINCWRLVLLFGAPLVIPALVFLLFSDDAFSVVLSAIFLPGALGSVRPWLRWVRSGCQITSENGKKVRMLQPPVPGSPEAKLEYRRGFFPALLFAGVMSACMYSIYLALLPTFGIDPDNVLCALVANLPTLLVVGFLGLCRLHPARFAAMVGIIALSAGCLLHAVVAAQMTNTPLAIALGTIMAFVPFVSLLLVCPTAYLRASTVPVH